MESQTHFNNEPVGLWLKDSFDELLIWASKAGFSDIFLISGLPIFGQLGKPTFKITERPVSSDEGFMLIDELSRSSGSSARIIGGDDLNISYEINDTISKERYRFRVSVTAIKNGYSDGINIVLRTIPSDVPTLVDMKLDSKVEPVLFPDNGLVLMTGVMGTGKSTLLAAVMREVIENQQRLLLTYEAPIEFDFSVIPNPQSPFAQSEIPRHLPNFEKAAENAMRRAAKVVMMGEARNKEELSSLLQMAERGIATYSTVHTKSAYDAPNRILSSFPQNERPAAASSMVDSLRLIVQQRLLPKKDEPYKRVAIREYYKFSDKDRRELLQSPIEHYSKIIRQKMIDQGTDLLTAVNTAYEKNLIDDYERLKIITERGNELETAPPSL